MVRKILYKWIFFYMYYKEVCAFMIIFHKRHKLLRFMEIDALPGYFGNIW